MHTEPTPPTGSGGGGAPASGGGSSSSPFRSHSSALRHVLSLGADDHHFVSHAAGVLADVIEKHSPTDASSLGTALRTELQKRGVTADRGGSFWDCLGKAVSFAWEKTKEFISDHAADIGKAAIDATGYLLSGAATALGAPEAIPAIESLAEASKGLIGGALPTEHIVGALRDIEAAPSTQKKAALIHRDCLLTNHGAFPSPVLSALHFAAGAAPHVRDAVVGGGLCSGDGKAERKKAYEEASASLKQLQPILKSNEKKADRACKSGDEAACDAALRAIKSQRNLIEKVEGDLAAAKTELEKHGEPIP